MASMGNDEKYRKFIELLPVNNYNVSKTAIEAGFSKSYALSKQKFIMNQALKYQLEQKGVVIDNKKQLPIVEVKRTMSEVVGISKESLMANIKFLAEQEKDLATRLKVVRPLAREYGVDLTDDQQQTTIIPTLNITVKEKKTTDLLPPVDNSTN